MGGGSSSLSDLTDVNITSPKKGDILEYDDITNKWINSETRATVTLTINGAKEDTVTIKDINDITISTCVFTSGATSGTCTLVDIPKDGGYYKFISSIAKDTATGTNNYEKIIAINASSSVVNVMPDGALYWYGNNISAITGGYVKMPDRPNGFVNNTNNMSMQYSNDGSCMTSNAISCVNKKLGYIIKTLTRDSTYNGFGYIDTVSNGTVSSHKQIDSTYSQNTVYAGILNNINGTYNIGVHSQLRGGIQVNALWLE